QGLELLQRIRLRPDPNRLPDNPVQVDEHPAAKETVDLDLPSCVDAGQPLERVWLVRGVVIHVQIRIAIQPVDKEVDDLLEGAFLFIRIVAPEGVMHALSALPVQGERFPNTEEVLDAVVADERIAFHVEEEVGRGRRRERLEAKVLAQRWQHLKWKRVAL